MCFCEQTPDKIMDNENVNPGSYPQPSQFEMPQPEQQPNQYQPPYPTPNQPPYPPQYNYPPPHQQQQQQQTTVIINQPQATVTQKGQPQNVRPWSTGLFGCFEDCGGCEIVWLCSYKIGRSFEHHRYVPLSHGVIMTLMSNNYGHHPIILFGWSEPHWKTLRFKPSLWPSGIDYRLGRNRLWVRFLVVSDIYSMFIEPTITWVPSGFSGYIWLDTKIVFKKPVKKTFANIQHLNLAHIEVSTIFAKNFSDWYKAPN